MIGLDFLNKTMRKTVYSINKIIILSKSKNYFFSVPGQNNNANFDTDVEAGAASEDENQVHFFSHYNLDDDHH